MALSTAIYTLLHNNATIEAAVKDRIYPGIAPFNAPLPCLVYKISSIEPNPTADDDYVWDKVSMTVSAITTQYTLSETYATNIRTALSRYSGTVDGETFDTIKFDGMTSDFVMNLNPDGTPSGSGVFIFECSFTFIRTS